jgi:hypothetical protein
MFCYALILCALYKGNVRIEAHMNVCFSVSGLFIKTLISLSLECTYMSLALQTGVHVSLGPHCIKYNHY